MTQPLNRPSWISVGVGSLLLAIGTSAVTASVNYGKQETALSSLIARNDELSKDRDKMENIVDGLRKSLDSQQSQLQTSAVKLQALQNDRCSPLVEQVNQLKNYVNEPYSYGYNAAKVPDLQKVLDGYQDTLRACYRSPL